MKKLKFLTAIIALIASATFTSCQVEQLDEELLEIEDEVAGPALFMVDFDGQTYVATTAQAQVQGNAVSILGLRGTAGESISLTIPGGTATGVYTNAVMMYVPSLTSTAFYSNTNPNSTTTNGAVNITSINTTTKTISGTFSFTGHYTDASQTLPAKSFTKGIFENIPYTGTMPGTNPGPGPGEEDNAFFKAVVDGTATDYSEDITVVTSVIDDKTYTNILASVLNSTEGITLNLHGIEDAGTYEIGSSMLDEANARYNSADGVNFTAESGVLVITSNEGGWLEGTFSFTAVNADDELITVTNGEFRVEN